MSGPETQQANYMAWRINQGAIIPFGSRGTQLAIATGFARDGSVKAKIWRASSGTFTKPRKIYAREFVRFATVADFRKYGCSIFHQNHHSAPSGVFQRTNDEVE